MKYDKVVKREDSIAPNPTESGWYVCSVRRSSVTVYNEKVSVYDYPISAIEYLIAEYEPRLLYWESNVWVTNPRSYQIIEEERIISWTKIPENYQQTVKVKY